MKKLFLTLLASYTIGAVSAQNNEPFSVKSLAGQSVKEVEIETSGGNISVESATADKARVEVFVWMSNGKRNSSATKEEIQKKLDEFYDLKVDVSGNKLTAIARSKSRKWDRNNSLSISFKIYTPSNVSTDLTTSGGNIDITDLNGQQKIVTSGGNLTIAKIKGKLNGTTSGGNITVKDCDDDIDLTTSGGNITADNCKGKIDLSTSGGSLKLTNMEGNTSATTSGGNVEAKTVSGELKASTSGGNVDLSGLSCDLNAGTSGGNIHVAFVQPGKYIKLANSGGDIVLQLPAGKGYDLDLSAGKIKTENLGNFSGKTSEDEMNGQLNGGGTKVTVHGRDGKLSLVMR